MSIVITNLSYQHPDKSLLFSNLNLIVNTGEKVNLIGNNGTGKSTLLKLIASELSYNQGDIKVNGDFFYLKQNNHYKDNITIKHILGVTQKLEALDEITKGSSNPKYFDILNDDWDIEEQIKVALNYWGLNNISLDTFYHTLSGGQQTKVQFAALMLCKASILLLDEPTNHLDWATRKLFYDFLKKYNGTVLVVSHDRTLLNQQTTTLELSSIGIRKFGGNYDFYKQEKEGMQASLEQKLDHLSKEIKQAKVEGEKLIKQQVKEKSQNKKKEKKAGLPKIVINTLKNKAENSAAKSKEILQQKANDLLGDKTALKQQIIANRVIDIRFPNSLFQNDKVLWIANDINYKYEHSKQNVFEKNMSFTIKSGDRVLLSDANGSGKSTIFNLLLQKLTVTNGILEKRDCTVVYLDQFYSLINGELTVSEQLLRFKNDSYTVERLNNLLFQYGIPVELWNNKIESLSGGEKLKVSLCCLSVLYPAIDVLLLDEPTNNLDIQGMNNLTQALLNYNGTLVIVSHDQSFIEELQLNREIRLGN
ncbi:ATP-binding cassette domain-containing protein [Myroides injenensis]|uniref:ATP-binding cassette domain-containing protein n=1 Tax=Myroides injenensis TaxID=1183151 RepID=UPI00028A320D|nr:ATP-binding cassette domain-containing protein [Myroides injenensis]